MKIWMIVAVCAFVFLVCFLLDTLFKHLFPKSKLEKSKQAVRPARRSATFGVICCSCRSWCCCFSCRRAAIRCCSSAASRR